MAIDLRAFEKRLNSDNAFRSRFLEKPVETLQEAGIVLPDEANRRLIESVGRLKGRHEPKPGSNLGIGPWDIQVMIEHPGHGR